MRTTHFRQMPTQQRSGFAVMQIQAQRFSARQLQLGRAQALSMAQGQLAMLEIVLYTFLTIQPVLGARCDGSRSLTFLTAKAKSISWSTLMCQASCPQVTQCSGGINTRFTREHSLSGLFNVPTSRSAQRQNAVGRASIASA